MKILAVNGSPKGKNGNTEVILKRFLEGCKNEKAEVEVVYLKEKDIKHCCGCFTCWERTPGKCVFDDDMKELLVKVEDADVLVYATPLYYFTVTGLMKDFLDRMLPLNTGEIISEDGAYSHPKFNENSKRKKTVLISNAGFPGNYNFSGLIETFNVMNKGKDIEGMILCSQGGALKAVEKNESLKKLYEPYFSAVIKAGEEFVREGNITKETQKILDKPVIDPETYIMYANARLK